MAETLATTYEAIRAAAAWRVVRRDGVLVSGPGALDWLQGQVSQDLSQLQVAPEAGGASVETLVLSPQGKIESSCRVSVVGPDRYLLDVRAGYGEVLFERLRRFKLRVKAELETLAGLSALQVRGPATPQVAELSLRGPALAVVAVTWPLWSGLDVLFQGELDGIEHVEPAVSVGPGDDEAFEAARIEAGVPELGLELTERTIPQESGELVARTVSFAKGCYTGQELVARVDARGANTPRRLHGVVITDAVRPAGGDEILVDGVAVGALTSVAWSPGFAAHVALAAVKRGTETTHEAQVIGAGGSARASIRSLPMVSG